MHFDACREQEDISVVLGSAIRWSDNRRSIGLCFDYSVHASLRCRHRLSRRVSTTETCLVTRSLRVLAFVFGALTNITNYEEKSSLFASIMTQILDSGCALLSLQLTEVFESWRYFFSTFYSVFKFRFLYVGG